MRHDGAGEPGRADGWRFESADHGRPGWGNDTVTETLVIARALPNSDNPGFY